MGNSRKLPNKELDNTYSTPDIMKMMKPTKMQWAKHVEHVREQEKHVILVGKLERNTQLPRHRHENNIKTDLEVKEIMWLR
jgi:hypothetical protein